VATKFGGSDARKLKDLEEENPKAEEETAG
jgi:hypothetical protein